MKSRVLVTVLMAAALAVGPLVSMAHAAGEIFIPILTYRTGPYAPSGIPIANGANDYLNLLNQRDGGINGVKIVFEECEMQYDTKQAVECYERLKSKNPVIVNPYSTGVTYQLIPKAPVDKVVVHSMGYGMTASADGRWFPWVFNFPMTWKRTAATRCSPHTISSSRYSPSTTPGRSRSRRGSRSAGSTRTGSTSPAGES